jgi:hypothetical protein
MVIVEGPDGSGKDTLIAAIGHRSFKLKALRGGVGGVSTYEAGNGLGDGTAGWAGTDPALLAYSRKITQARGTNIAFNRFHLSEYVYGPLLRDRQELRPADLLFMRSFLYSYNVPVILCLPSFAQTMRNVSLPGRERPAYQTDDFLAEAYDRFADLREFATVVYDFTLDPTAETVKSLL